MKKSFLYLVALAAMMILLPNCKNSSDNVFDIISKYVGDWDFTVCRTTFLMDSIAVFDTINYIGGIFSKDTDQIDIKYTDCDSVLLHIDGSGNLSGFPTPQYSCGEFTSDNTIHLYLRWGGLGGGKIHVVDGMKR